MQAYWRKFGAGPRKCLAFHCSLAHSGAWRSVAKSLTEFLGDDLTIHAMDSPAHGKSGGGATDPDQIDMAIDWACERLSEPMDVFGHSFGAYLALRLALQRPDMVRSLWLYEPVFFASVRESHPNLYAENDARLAAIRSAIEEGDPEMAARLFMTKWGDGEDWERQPEATRSYFAERIEHILAVNPWVVRDVNGVLAELTSLTMPVRLVDGGASPEIIGKIQDSLAETLPNAARATLQGLSHMAPLTDPQICAEDIAAFLRRV